MPHAYETEEMPLTPSQYGVWLAVNRHPRFASSYNLASFNDITGPLDIDSWIRSAQFTVDSIGGLRAQFFCRSDGSPCQRFSRPFSICAEVIDLTHEADPFCRAHEWLRY